MLKAFTTGLGVLLAATAVVRANDLPAGDVLQEEYRRNSEQIDRIFRDKVQKISERPALPQEMRDLLTKQADEVRDFDSKTLKDKMDMKIRQARERDRLKERLRRDAENRVQWLVDEEERFERARDAKQREEEAQPAAVDAQPAAESEPAETAEPQKAEERSEQPEKTENAPAAETEKAEEGQQPAAESEPAAENPESAAATALAVSE